MNVELAVWPSATASFLEIVAKVGLTLVFSALAPVVITWDRKHHAPVDRWE
jgi:hypothetical protein